MWAESWGSTDTLLSAFNALVCGDGVKRPGSVMATEGGKLREGACLGSWGKQLCFPCDSLPKLNYEIIKHLAHPAQNKGSNISAMIFFMNQVE